jgi:hypothetical protein
MRKGKRRLLGLQGHQHIGMEMDGPVILHDPQALKKSGAGDIQEEQKQAE